jgi:hypothetical protein
MNPWLLLIVGCMVDTISLGVGCCGLDVAWRKMNKELFQKSKVLHMLEWGPQNNYFSINFWR